MNLYAFQPNGHGQYSFFVCSANEEEAIKAVNRYIEKNKNTNQEPYLTDYSVQGFGTTYYNITMLKPDEVIDNAND